VLVLRGKSWLPGEEKRLRELIGDKKPLTVIAETLGKSMEAVRVKIRRLGLVVVDREKNNFCSTTTTARLVLPSELFSVEEVMKELHAAVAGLKTSGLDKTEVMRLRGIIGGCKVYKEMLADYLDYRGLELELLTLRERYEALAEKAKGASAK
jgi:ribonucleotide monophosphatase NagD (HAD superfamily)